MAEISANPIIDIQSKQLSFFHEKSGRIGTDAIGERD